MGVLTNVGMPVILINKLNLRIYVLVDYCQLLVYNVLLYINDWWIEYMKKLYHGTISSGAENIIKYGINLKHGKLKVDFGQGFYTTPSFSFAKSTAINRARKTNSYNQIYVEPYVLIFEYNERNAKENCNILNFTNSNTKWAQFIINNRNGFEYMNSVGSHFHNINHKYDIVQGSIADNDIVVLSQTLCNLKKKVENEDIDNMIYNYITNQVSFHTYKSLKYLELTECVIIKEKERRCC